MDTGELVSFGIFLAANFLTAMSGALFAPGPWYENLNHPSFRPPNWLFAPVWAVLFLMIATSGWLVWQAAGWAAAPALTVYGLHLALNFAWSGIFFGLHRPGWAFIEVIALWLSVLATILLFWPHSPLAGQLLLPYLAWVSFAAALNFAIWRRNPNAHLARRVDD